MVTRTMLLPLGRLAAVCFAMSVHVAGATEVAGSEPNKDWGFWKWSGAMTRSLEEEAEHAARYLKQNNLRGLGLFGNDDTEAPSEDANKEGEEELIESVPCEPVHSKAVEFVEMYGDLKAGNAACAADADPDSCGGGCCRFGAFFICDEDNRMAHLPCVCNRNTNTPKEFTASFTEEVSFTEEEHEKAGEAVADGPTEAPGVLDNLMGYLTSATNAPVVDAIEKNGPLKEEFEEALNGGGEDSSTSDVPTDDSVVDYSDQETQAPESSANSTVTSEASGSIVETVAKAVGLGGDDKDDQVENDKLLDVGEVFPSFEDISPKKVNRTDGELEGKDDDAENDKLLDVGEVFPSFDDVLPKKVNETEGELEGKDEEAENDKLLDIDSVIPSLENILPKKGNETNSEPEGQDDKAEDKDFDPTAMLTALQPIMPSSGKSGNETEDEEELYPAEYVFDDDKQGGDFGEAEKDFPDPSSVLTSIQDAVPKIEDILPQGKDGEESNSTSTTEEEEMYPAQYVSDEEEETPDNDPADNGGLLGLLGIGGQEDRNTTKTDEPVEAEKAGAIGGEGSRKSIGSDAGGMFDFLGLKSNSTGDENKCGDPGAKCGEPVAAPEANKAGAVGGEGSRKSIGSDAGGMFDFLGLNSNSTGDDTEAEKAGAVGGEGSRKSIGSDAGGMFDFLGLKSNSTGDENKCGDPGAKCGEPVVAPEANKAGGMFDFLGLNSNSTGDDTEAETKTEEADTETNTKKEKEELIEAEEELSEVEKDLAEILGEISGGGGR